MFVPLVKAQVRNYVDGFLLAKPLFRYVSLALTAYFALSQVSLYFNAFALTASNVFSFHLWRLVTNFLVETNFLRYAWSIIAAYQFTVIIAPVWGLREVVKYAIIVQGSASLAVAACSLLYMALRRTSSSVDFYFYGHLNGLSAVSMAALVAVKQFLPDGTVVATPLGRIKNTHMPVNAVLLSVVLAVAGFLRGAIPFQTLFALQISWSYLRFYQVHHDAEIIGDDSDHFTWASLFPRKVQHVADAVGNVTFRLLVTLRVCKPIRHVDMSDLNSVKTVVPPEFQNRDAERRRQKALRELNERLNRSKNNSAPHLASLQAVAGTGLIPTALPPAQPCTSSSSVHTALSVEAVQRTSKPSSIASDDGEA